MEETSNDSDRMFLLSLLTAMKQLSPLDNVDFRVEVQETLRRKLRRHAAREVELITISSTPSASLHYPSIVATALCTTPLHPKVMKEMPPI